MFLGADSNEFVDYYNNVSGRDLIDIQIRDLIDKSKIALYVSNILVANSDPTKVVQTLYGIASDIYDYFVDSFPQENCREFLTVAKSKINNDQFLNLLLSMSKDRDKSGVIIKNAEGTDKDYAKSVLLYVGVPVTVISSITKARVIR